jgi:CRP-like cAMP-binding protein
MYFIVEGEVEVLQNDERLGYLGPGSFFGENPVIEAIEGKGGDGSEIRLRTVRSTVASDLVRYI